MDYINSQTSLQTKAPLPFSKKVYVERQLKKLGLDWIELHRSEAALLPSIIHSGETIGGVIAGHSDRGHIMIVATNTRLIIMDCKPFFNKIKELNYSVISGVSSSQVGPFHTIKIHSRLGDFVVKTVYAKAAESFGNYIDERCIGYTQPINQV